MRALAVTPARRRPTTWLAVGLLVVGLGMFGFACVSLLWPGWAQQMDRPGSTDDPAATLTILLAVSTVAIVGAILSILRPHNLVGWLLLTAGVAFALGLFAPVYVDVGTFLDVGLPGQALFDWLAPAAQDLGFILLVIWLPLLFPDGRLPSLRWRILAWPLAVATPIGISLILVTDPFFTERRLPNPLALDGALGDIAEGVVEVLTLVQGPLVVVVLLSVLLRFRRSRGIERQQLKWFMAAASLLAIVGLIGSVEGFLDSVQWGAWTLIVFPAALAFLPVAIGIAVLRYRLYEIDRLISRTIGWAIVTGVLVAVFALLVLGSSALLEPLTGGNTLAVAGSTLVVASLFTPLRRRVQRTVDRRFDRARYDGERLLGAFSARVRDEVDLATIRADVLATVGSSVRPARVGLWLRRPEGER